MHVCMWCVCAVWHRYVGTLCGEYEVDGFFLSFSNSMHCYFSVFFFICVFFRGNGSLLLAFLFLVNIMLHTNTNTHRAHTHTLAQMLFVLYFVDSQAHFKTHSMVAFVCNSIVCSEYFFCCVKSTMLKVTSQQQHILFNKWCT